MTCIYTYPSSWPWDHGMNMLLSCGRLVYVTSCFLHELKRKSLLSLPFADREPLTSTGGCILQASAVTCHGADWANIEQNLATAVYLAMSSLLREDRHRAPPPPPPPQKKKDHPWNISSAGNSPWNIFIQGFLNHGICHPRACGCPCMGLRNLFTIVDGRIETT